VVSKETALGLVDVQRKRRKMAMREAEVRGGGVGGGGKSDGGVLGSVVWFCLVLGRLVGGILVDLKPNRDPPPPHTQNKEAHQHPPTNKQTPLNQTHQHHRKTGVPCAMEEYDRLMRAYGVQNRPKEAVALLRVRACVRACSIWLGFGVVYSGV
jgi:hypothetical protein